MGNYLRVLEDLVSFKISISCKILTYLSHLSPELQFCLIIFERGNTTTMTYLITLLFEHYKVNKVNKIPFKFIPPCSYWGNKV